MKSSLVERKFKNLLKNKDIKFISFDIFETLVFRKVNKASDIFYLVGKHKYVKKIYDKAETFQYFRMEAEKVARAKNSHLEDVTLNLIYDELSLSKREKHKIMRIEIEEEYKSLYINKQIEKWIKLAYKSGKKVLLISDMYLTSKEILSLVLSKLKHKNYISKLYVSNEHNATKATGKLYSLVLKELKHEAKSLLHIGDNGYSDVEMAKLKGIHTLHYSCDTSVYEQLHIESNYIKKYSQSNNFRVQASLLNPYVSKEERFFFNLGATIFGPVLWEFSHWINNIAKKNEISQINCVMREGRIFAKYIKKINKDLDINLIYASRKSTFLPAIDLENLKKNGFNFFQYRKFSIENFYELFKLKINRRVIKKNRNLLLKDANKIIYKDKNLLDIIVDDFVTRIKEVQKSIKKEKKLFRHYLEQLSYTPHSILLDFGGTGTILENISHALPKSKHPEIHTLFFMHTSGFRKMLKLKTLNFLPLNSNTVSKVEKLRRSPEFIEVLFNGINQTTLYYTKRSTTVEAVTDIPYKDIEHTKKISYAFDKGVDAFFKIAKLYKLQKNSYSNEHILDFISRLIEVPTKEEANYIGNIYHDEGYGNVLVEKLTTKKHIQKIQKISVEKAYYHNAYSSAYQIGKIPWVQGVITKLDPDYISNINGLKIKNINEDSIAKIMEMLNEMPKRNEVYIYGGGEFFLELLPHLSKGNISIKGVIDTKARFAPYTISNYDVTSLDNAGLKDGDTIIVSSAVFAIEITTLIISYAKEKQIKLSLINFYNGFLDI